MDTSPMEKSTSNHAFAAGRHLPGSCWQWKLGKKAFKSIHFFRLVAGGRNEVKGRATRLVFVAVCRMWPLCPSPATQMLAGAGAPGPTISAQKCQEKGQFPVCGGCSGVWGSPDLAQPRGTAQSWKGLGQRVRLSVKAKDSEAAAGAWKVNFCSRATRKMKSSVLASCSPGQALLPGKGAQITWRSPGRAPATSEPPLACAALHRLRQLFFLKRLGGNVHPHNLLKPSPEVYCRANCACSERRRAETV